MNFENKSRNFVFEKSQIFLLERMCCFMALSNHINPKSLKKISSGTRTSRTIFGKKKVKKFQKIRRAISIFHKQNLINLCLNRRNLKVVPVKKFISDELKIVNEKRKSELGLRAYRPDANVIGVGTLRISDDSLEKMGYDKSKKWSDQTDQARENVSIVYNAMVQNAVSKPDMYGKFFNGNATRRRRNLKHVDYMTTGVDAERPTWSMREVLNGKEWRDEDNQRRFPPKGSKLQPYKMTQIRFLMSRLKMILDYIVAKHIPKKVDMAKNTRQVSKELDAERDLLNKRRRSKC